MYIQMERGNKKYSFDSENGFIEAGINSPVYIVGTVNWGMAPSHRITQRGPFQDGDTDVDFRLDLADEILRIRSAARPVRRAAVVCLVSGSRAGGSFFRVQSPSKRQPLSRHQRRPRPLSVRHRRRPLSVRRTTL